MKKAYSYMCLEEIDESTTEDDFDNIGLEKVKTFFFDSKESKLDWVAKSSSLKKIRWVFNDSIQYLLFWNYSYNYISLIKLICI